MKMANILLVEDEPISQRVVQLMIEGVGHQVAIAASGKEALKLINANNYDLVFMDLGLPDTTGDQLTVKIRNSEHKNRDVPIIALTAHVFHNDKKRCLAAGMNGFLGKPIEHSDLVKTLDTWVIGDKAKNN